MKRLSRKQMIERATEMQNDAYATGVDLATKHVSEGNKSSFFQDKEIVICAAVKFDENKIIRGHRHVDCYLTNMRTGDNRGHGEEGFITSRNRFVGRSEAYYLQIKAGIKSVALGGYDPLPRLFSEDLY